MNKHTATMDFLGNIPLPWQQTAEGLLVAGMILKERREVALGAYKAKYLSHPALPPPFPKEGDTYWIELMLMGFAIENLLKALWLANGNTLYKGGKIPANAVGKAHDLADLASRVEFKIDNAERTDLIMLKRIMTGIGRYPRMRDATQDSGGASWTHESDTRMTLLLTRLREQVAFTEAKNKKSNALARVAALQADGGLL